MLSQNILIFIFTGPVTEVDLKSRNATKPIPKYNSSEFMQFSRDITPTEETAKTASIQSARGQRSATVTSSDGKIQLICFYL